MQATGSLYNFKPNLTAKTFWEFDLSALDLNDHADSIIVRVFERGSIDEIIETIVYYGEEKCKNVLLNTPYLMEKTMYLTKSIFKIPLIQAFKCYTTKQFHPIS
jgi:hypothetical protein